MHKYNLYFFEKGSNGSESIILIKTEDQNLKTHIFNDKFVIRLIELHNEIVNSISPKPLNFFISTKDGWSQSDEYSYLQIKISYPMIINSEQVVFLRNLFMNKLNE